MKIQSLETIKSGTSPKTGKPWTLVKATFEGQSGFHTGFLYEPTMAGADVDAELYQEEYNGKMQNKFKIGGGKRSAPQAPAFDNERLMRMEALLVNINTHVMRLYKHAGIDKTPEYPTQPVGEPNFDNAQDLSETDVPF
jgi:hypothetical protein